MNKNVSERQCAYVQRSFFTLHVKIEHNYFLGTPAITLTSVLPGYFLLTFIYFPIYHLAVAAVIILDIWDNFVTPLCLQKFPKNIYIASLSLGIILSIYFQIFITTVLSFNLEHAGTQLVQQEKQLYFALLGSHRSSDVIVIKEIPSWLDGVSRQPLFQYLTEKRAAK